MHRQVIDLASRWLAGRTTPDPQLMIAQLEHAAAERRVARMDGVVFRHRARNAVHESLLRSGVRGAGDHPVGQAHRVVAG